MISKEAFRILFFLVFLIFYSDGKRRRDDIRSYNESLPDLVTTIAGSIFILLSCISGMVWKICRCFRKQRRRKRVEIEMNYLNFIQENNFQIFTIHELNENNLLTNETHVRQI
jgi:hypothetical protein